MSDHILSQLRVDRASSVPMYQQIQQQLEDLINAGMWRLKEPLPSETALAEKLQISVMTVRQAMAQLVNKGLIYREKGRGTFVMPQPLDHHLQRLESFSEDMQARNMRPASETLVFEYVPVPDLIAPRLDLAPGTEVLHLKRLRLVDTRPVAVHDAYVNRTGITRDELEQRGSLYQVLEQLGVEMLEGDETLEAVTADPPLAGLLETRPGAPILKATRLTWDRSHTPLEHVVALYRADFYRYTVRLRR
ncbi:MAG: GntR family transcriptional regulator [Anaerolineae bacterium]|nr:GntR family transcriptional regulator [Anaerolineae bacterium]